MSLDTTSRTTDAIVEDMVTWQNRPTYVAMGINLDGKRDLLGM